MLVKGTNTGHQAENFLAEIRFQSLKEKVGQHVYLGQAYNQRGLVGTYWKCPAIADYIPASLYSLDRQSLGSAGRCSPSCIPLCLSLSWKQSLWQHPAFRVCMEFLCSFR